MTKALPVLYPSVLCIALLALAACANTSEAPVRKCPQVAILRPLERVEDYGNDTVDSSTLVAVAVMQSLSGKCAYESNGVDLNFTLSMKAEKGPNLGGNRISFPYSVSVITPDDKIIAKDMMTATFTFDDKTKLATTEEPLHVFLPLAKDEDASTYRVLTGFQLTESQLKAARTRQIQSD